MGLGICAGTLIGGRAADRYRFGAMKMAAFKLANALGAATGGRKGLMIIDGADHVDLYGQTDIIPVDKLQSVFEGHLACSHEAGSRASRPAS
ncbi:hypothetical protein [Thioclava sp. DLFJ4-1]|uniref:hypothetical protein n=1 Tax=Thioclava sp. DLFJ4-1 TaxID=1915313 RepID=UPI00117C0BA1|nr:hypothetical protein [Thioclava sp. DLFJ4-1]